VSFVHVLRGGLLESRHQVHAAVVNSDGRLIAKVGNPSFSTFLRSSAKAFQVQPLIPFLDKLNLESRHLAIAMASHAGDAIHVETVLELLVRAGVDSAWLKCGIHAPFDPETRKEMRVIGLKPTVLQNNCSGKHAAMLAACLAKGLPTQNYYLPGHPLQQEILEVIKTCFGTSDIGMAMDGCSVPCFRVPLENAALAMSRLAEPSRLPGYETGLELAFSAMRDHPHLIAGTNRSDTVLMQTQDNLISKIGAEAYVGVAVRDSSHGHLGIAMKIEDGSERAGSIALLQILEQLNVLSDPSALESLRTPVTKNHAGLEVGEYRAAFDLEFL
jgi:L-asparaginase II